MSLLTFTPVTNLATGLYANFTNSLYNQFTYFKFTPILYLQTYTDFNESLNSYVRIVLFCCIKMGYIIPPNQHQRRACQLHDINHLSMFFL